MAVGDDVVLLKLSDPEDPTSTSYPISDQQRTRSLLWVVVAAAALIVGFARWRGAAALVGLAVSFAVVPAARRARDRRGPCAAPRRCHGLRHHHVRRSLPHRWDLVRTSVAVLGTLASLVLTGVLGLAATAATHLTGFGSGVRGVTVLTRP